MEDNQANSDSVQKKHWKDDFVNKSGKEYWRSFEELAESPEFQESIAHEFPQVPEVWDKSTTRRKFLQLMGSAIAMAGLAGCTREPTEKIVPYVKAPEDMIPGRPLYFATAIPMAGFARGLLVENHMGRPTKIEGNPNHPDSLGAADAVMQASIMSLYDPERLKNVVKNGRMSTWDAFISHIQIRLEAQAAKSGAGLRILTETVISPTLAMQLRNILKKFPEAKWHQYSPQNRDNERSGLIAATGRDYGVQFNLAKADIILSLDADFLTEGPGALRYAREFATRRKVRSVNSKTKGVEGMNRLYSIEATPTLTGAMADHRLAVKASNIQALLAILSAKLGLATNEGKDHEFSETQMHWIAAVAEDLKQAKGRSLLIAGRQQPDQVHAMTAAINNALGNLGKTVIFTDTVEMQSVDQMGALKELVKDLNAGEVDDLIIFESNVVYKAPADLDLTQAIQKAKERVYLGLGDNETAQWCQWNIPASHFLESWSDARAYDGTVSIIQPLIHPLYASKTSHELASVLEGKIGLSGHDIVQGVWKKQVQTPDFKKAWEKVLHDGFIPGTRFNTLTVTIKTNLAIATPRANVNKDELEIIFRPNPLLGDGDDANNGWLQELPQPMTRITWDNAILIAPKTAQKYGLKNESMADLTLDGRTLSVPVWLSPGHAEDSTTLYLGYGRTRVGKVGQGVGFNAFALQNSTTPNISTTLKLKRGKGKYALATTQDHATMSNRALVRVTDKDNFEHHPEFAQHMVHDPKPSETLYKPEQHLKGEYQWGMTIDLNACNGCGACTIACQSENNIPVVGKDQVLVGREMHWIRVDRYYKGDVENPETYHQPVPCMHCENAPCEPVCPVGATVHSDEGLNEMTYNRCVGTRYCSNNCSYKVRRFNFYNFVDSKTPQLKMQRNPDVTIRTRGVMEKCTYCVQRINTAKIDAKKQDRKVRDGEIVTACQQTCPTQAIEFGDIANAKNRVAIAKADDLNYGILTDLGTRPRTTYLAKVRNPNPVLEPHQGAVGVGH